MSTTPKSRCCGAETEWTPADELIESYFCRKCKERCEVTEDTNSQSSIHSEKDGYKSNEENNEPQFAIFQSIESFVARVSSDEFGYDNTVSLKRNIIEDSLKFLIKEAREKEGKRIIDIAYETATNNDRHNHAHEIKDIAGYFKSK